MKKHLFKSRLLALLLICIIAALLTACGGGKSKTPVPTDIPPEEAKAPVTIKVRYTPAPGQVSECWQPLADRLLQDPKASPELVQYFGNLSDYSAHPMGVKVKELFSASFQRRSPPPSDGKPRPPPSNIYRNVVNEATMKKCEDFLAENKAAIDRMERNYPVPGEIIAALLYVETRHGNYLGKANAFWSLACMAAADSPDKVEAGIVDLPITDEHGPWLQEKLTDKSNWAYREMRALLTYCNVQDLDPHSMPGSVYGAIGICQFMPSNLVPYAADGDGDGVIDLFCTADAIASAANYLTKHGWKRGMSVDGQRNMLKRYNNSTIYANTILTLAESVRTGIVQTKPPVSASSSSSATLAKNVKSPKSTKKR